MVVPLWQYVYLREDCSYFSVGEKSGHDCLLVELSEGFSQRLKPHPHVPLKSMLGMTMQSCIGDIGGARSTVHSPVACMQTLL